MQVWLRSLPLCERKTEAGTEVDVMNKDLLSAQRVDDEPIQGQSHTQRTHQYAVKAEPILILFVEEKLRVVTGIASQDGSKSC